MIGSSISKSALLPEAFDEEFANTKPADKPSGAVADAINHLSELSNCNYGFSRRQFVNDFYSTVPLLLFDIIAVMAVAAAASVCARLVGSSNGLFGLYHSISVVAWTVLIQHIHGLYPACGLTHTLEYRRVLRTCLIVVTGVLSYAVGTSGMFGRDFVACLIFSILLFILLPSLRSACRWLFAGCDWWAQPVLIVGENENALQMFRRLSKNRSEGLRPLGIAFDANKYWQHDSNPEKHYVGTLSEIVDIMCSTGTCRIALTDREQCENVTFDVYNRVPHVSIATELHSHPTEKSHLNVRDGFIDIECFNGVTSLTAQAAKRGLDLFLLLVFSPIFLPIILMIALLVKLTSTGPVFYRTARIGRGGKEFFAWKIRSMIEDADVVLLKYLNAHPEFRTEYEREHKLRNDPRITKIGKFIRRTSLDELPQLWNVLVGEMSMVGPRPMLCSEAAKYGDVFQLYALMRPGITGLWQVSGRNNTTYQERLDYVRHYVQNWSCMMDIYILYRTIKVAILQEGAY